MNHKEKAAGVQSFQFNKLARSKDFFKLFLQMILQLIVYSTKHPSFQLWHTTELL